MSVLVQLGGVQTDLEKTRGGVLVVHACLEQLLRMVTIHGFTIVEGVRIVLHGQAQSALIRHKVGSQFHWGIKEIEGWQGSRCRGGCRL